MYEFLTYKKRTKQEKRTDVPRASQMCHHVDALCIRTSDAVQYRILHVFPILHLFLKFHVTLFFRRKKIRFFIAFTESQPNKISCNNNTKNKQVLSPPPPPTPPTQTLPPTPPPLRPSPLPTNRLHRFRRQRRRSRQHRCNQQTAEVPSTADASTAAASIVVSDRPLMPLPQLTTKLVQAWAPPSDRLQCFRSRHRRRN
jgi:hypothetical protein